LASPRSSLPAEEPSPPPIADFAGSISSAESPPLEEVRSTVCLYVFGDACRCVGAEISRDGSLRAMPLAQGVFQTWAKPRVAPASSPERARAPWQCLPFAALRAFGRLVYWPAQLLSPGRISALRGVARPARRPPGRILPRALHGALHPPQEARALEAHQEWDL